MVQIQKLQV